LRQIDYLGAMPTVQPKPVNLSGTAREMLRFDLENEASMIRNYRERIRQCEAMGEFAIAVERGGEGSLGGIAKRRRDRDDGPVGVAQHVHSLLELVLAKPGMRRKPGAFLEGAVEVNRFLVQADKTGESGLLRHHVRDCGGRDCAEAVDFSVHPAPDGKLSVSVNPFQFDPSKD
jgi:hypothetical protein